MTVAFLVCCTSVLAKEKPVKDYEKILFGPSKMARVELQMPDTTWQTILKEARRKQYHLCAVTINGERLDSVAIRTKGASSLDDVAGMKSNRYSFTLKLNHFKKGQKYHGLSKILLNNNIWDASQIKDAIVYDMARYMGLPAPLTNFAELRVNGQLQGYYLLVEPIDKDFCRRNYPDVKSNVYKPYHNLSYKGDDLKAYADIAREAKVGGGDASMQHVVAAFKSVDESKDVDRHVDVENVMKYMALQTMAVNFDCMTGHNMQNFYLYEADGRIALLPWDYNLAWGGYPDDEGDWGDWGDFDPSQWGNWPGFGGHHAEGDSLSHDDAFPHGGAHAQEGDHPHWDMPMMGGWGNEGFSIAQPGEDLGQSTPEEVSQIVNFPINTPFTEKLEKRKFFMNLLANEQYKVRYYHYLDQLCSQYIQGGGMKKFLRTVNKQMGKKAGTEPNKFYTNKQFHAGVEMLANMLRRKAQSVLGQLDGTVPSTWDEQKQHPEKLINCDGINLRLTGGLGY